MPVAKKSASRRAPKRTTSRTRASVKADPVEETPIDATPSYNDLPSDEDQRRAYLDAYAELKNAGVAIPDVIRIPVEQLIDTIYGDDIRIQAENQERQEKALNDRIADLNMHGPSFIRNCTNSPFNLRLERQQEGIGRQRRIELKPRGMPGDMHPLKDGDEQDPILQTNLQMGLIEIIPAGEAQLIIQKQTHNANVRVHTPSQILINEYKTLRDNHVNVSEHPSIKIEAEYNNQGVTVATIDPTAQPGSRQFKNRQFGDLQRNSAPINSQYIPTGGNPVSIQLSGQEDMEGLVRRDQLARSHRTQDGGPQSVLGELSVVVEPTQRMK